MTETGPQRPNEIPRKFAKPLGVLPRNLQTWVIGGIALLMVLVIALSGRPPERKQREALPVLQALDPSRARIEEYQARIEEAEQRLAAEQAALELSRQALVAPAEPQPAPRPVRRVSYEARREPESFASSNLALSYRGEPPVTPRFVPAPAGIAQAYQETGAGRRRV